jgi:probable F420-dependent oxidoreductase
VQVFTTVPLLELSRAGELFAELEEVGYDGAFTYETNHDPFLPLTLAATQTSALRLGTSIAIAFARTPMLLANVGWDLQDLSHGRFTLGLGSQIRPHITKRYSMPWSRPAARMHEMVRAIRAIWDHWDGIADLDFRGEFYTHTLMTPVFVPGPHRYGRARIHVAGVGPAMTQVAGEVADGFIAHPFNTRRSLQELSWPALDAGIEAAGRDRDDVERVVVCLSATGDTGADLDDAVATVRRQLAFYASTPAYAKVLEVHGWEGIHPTLNAMSKQGRWDDMADLISDEILETIAVVGRRDQIAGLVRDKLDGEADVVSLECTRRPDPTHFADIVAALRDGRTTD